MSLQILSNYLTSQYKKINNSLQLPKIIDTTPINNNVLDEIHFVSDEIKNEIKQYLEFTKTFTYQYKSSSISISIYDYKKNNTNYLSLVNKLSTLFFIFSEINNYQNQLNITLYLTNKKKQLDYSKNYIGVNEVNSGASLFRDSKYAILIWRKEELVKVFIHELFHSLFFDFRKHKDQYSQQLLQILNINNQIDIKLYECYVETWANLINLIMKSYFQNSDLYSNIKKEIDFAIKQSSKILLFFNYKCFSNCEYSFLLTPNNKPNQSFSQKTSVLSYYILKSVLLLNYDKFIKFCTYHNHNLFIFNENNILIFNNLIIETLTNKKTQNKINKYMENYKQFIFSNNLRMTLL